MTKEKLNIQIPIDSIPVAVTHTQKRIIEEVVMELYNGVGAILMDIDEERVVEILKENVAGHFQRLVKNIFEDERYIIEVIFQENTMILDVEVMVKGGYDKKQIYEEISSRDLEKLSSLEGNYVINLLNEQWGILKKGNQIKFMKVI